MLNKEWRHEIDSYDNRLPGGKVFDTLQEYTKHLENNNSMEQAVVTAAIRESQEEVWLDVRNVNIFSKKYVEQQ